MTQSLVVRPFQTITNHHHHTKQLQTTNNNNHLIQTNGHIAIVFVESKIFTFFPFQSHFIAEIYFLLSNDRFKFVIRCHNWNCAQCTYELYIDAEQMFGLKEPLR